MVKMCGQLLGRQSRKKSGFGITEVLIAAAVLGFLYMAVLNLQEGNHDALLRIRSRDGATEVAKEILDSLNSGGIANLADDQLALSDCGGGVHCLMLARKSDAGLLSPDTLRYSRTWKGQPGVIEHDMKVDYKAVVKVSSDDEFRSANTSYLLGGDSVKHVYAKRLDVTVFWKFKGAEQSIAVSGVIK